MIEKITDYGQENIRRQEQKANMSSQTTRESIQRGRSWVKTKITSKKRKEKKYQIEVTTNTGHKREKCEGKSGLSLSK